MRAAHLCRFPLRLWAAAFACAAVALLQLPAKVWSLEPIPQLDYTKDVAPLLKKYCLDCHAGKEPEGKLRIDALDPNGGRIMRKEWQKVRDNLHSMLMPPADSEQPSPKERATLVTWLDSHPLHIDCSGPVHPGRVTIRRLNRAEYNNTIRDLCHIDFKPADDFPNDDVGYGFDNIGDVLSLPPILLEKYLRASEEIVRQAILTFDESSAQTRRERGRVLASVGEVALSAELSQPGEYLLRVRAAGQQAGPDKAKLELRLNDKEIKTIATENSRRDDFRTYEHPLQLKPGKHKLAAAFTNDYYEPKHEDEKLRGDRNLNVEFVELVGPIGVKPDQLPTSHTEIIFVEPGPAKKPDECAREIFKRFASRAYRRPAKDAEVERLVKLFTLAQQNGEPFERGIQLGVQAILVSPHFLFKVEQEPTAADPNGIRTLNEYELATRLSYFLWSTAPDPDLLSLAHQGSLRKNLDAQVQRMLKDSRSDALVANFAGQWLHLRALEITSPDPKQFPSFDDDLRQAMRKETELFFSHIVREDRSILEFLDSDYTFVNDRLAKHYGIGGVSGAEFVKVAVPADQRGGLLGHASILTVTSNPNRTSPVKRGKWVLENLLAAPPPPAPPNVPQLEEGQKAAEGASLRQRLELHRANAACASCHKLMDPPGFALENYDAVGAWRTEDGKHTIDPAGVMPDGQEIKGVRDLRMLLKKRDNEFRRCLAEKLMTYALGRGLELDDECTLRAISDDVGRKDNKFSALVLAIVHSDQFQKRARIRSKMD